ncbi:hypothetical protein AGR56_09090 [Clostridium sp. DMHC 10]|uniref:phage major capsid protein n=1 Tax=Clostridium sp. DMHC 10 TaxID=747377 RepID=UPI00069EE7B0|nr:phage major capsid protein [Clostridium sp. DMHC 10]KOF56809.1 hypothetical protein AGR56_09090 [Clostridium sp. DMHC 10]
MKSIEIRMKIGEKITEARKLIDENKLDEAEKVMEEKRNLDKQLKITEEVEAEEKRDLEAQAEKEKKEKEDAEDRKKDTKVETDNKTITKEEARDFASFVRGEKRALSAGDNGGIIPTSIANQIITKVHEISPIYSLATVYNVSGKLVLPKYNEDESSITCSYMDEFTELVEGTGKFATIDLDDFIIGVLAKISKSLINRNDFDVTNFVINEVAKSMSRFIEKELINGTAGKMTGVLSAKNVLTTSGASISADDIIDVEAEIPDVYLTNAVFIMNKKTRTSLKKLKDGQGNYLLQKDFTTGSRYNLLGHPVYISENMPIAAAGNKAIAFGDMSGLAVKVSNSMETTILNEKYATQYAVGVCAYVEMDSDIQDEQKIVVLQVKAGA